MPTEPPRELEGWKGIAHYLGVTPRTAQKWEKHHGLPVYRPVDEKKGRVFAHEGEIDAWRNKGMQRSKLRRARNFPFRALIACSFVVLGMLTAYRHAIRPGKPGKPVKAVIVDGSIDILDDQGRHCFSFNRPGLFVEAYTKALGLLSERADRPVKDRMLLFTDLGRDGSVETLIGEVTERGMEIGNRLVCLAEDGSELWRFKYGKALDLHGASHTGTYGADFIFPVLDGRYVLVVAHHDPGALCQVSLLDPSAIGPNGEPERQSYWHPGRFNSAKVFDIDGDGNDELILAGSNNPGLAGGLGQPSVVVLGLPFGSPRETKGPPNYFWPENAVEEAYLLLPKPDVFEALAMFAQARIRSVARGRLDIDVTDHMLDHPYVVYQLSADLEVKALRVSRLLRSLHRELRLSRKLDHDLEEGEFESWQKILRFETAPDGNGPDVQRMFKELQLW